MPPFKVHAIANCFGDATVLTAWISKDVQCHGHAEVILRLGTQHESIVHCLCVTLTKCSHTHWAQPIQMKGQCSVDTATAPDRPSRNTAALCSRTSATNEVQDRNKRVVRRTPERHRTGAPCSFAKMPLVQKSSVKHRGCWCVGGRLGWAKTPNRLSIVSAFHCSVVW
jgi:hypothetical protein